MSYSDVTVRNADGSIATLPDYEEEELGDGEDDESPEPADSEAVDATDTATDDVQKVLARYKTPEQLAKAILEKDRFISKQGNEIGQYRKNGKPTPDTSPVESDTALTSEGKAALKALDPTSDWLTTDELRELYPENYGDTPQHQEQGDAADGAPGAADTPAETPEPETQAEVTTAADDAFDFEPTDPSIFFDEERDPIDEDSGWPLDSDGDPYQPANVYGVLYTPESRWKIRAIELSEANPENAAYAAHLLAQERQAEESRVYQESIRHLEIRNRQQQKEVAPYVEEIATKLSRRFPEPVAKALATFYEKSAENFIREEAKAGRIHPMRLMSKSLLKDVTRGAYTGALEAETLEADAQMIREHLEKRGVQMPAPITRDTSRDGANKNGKQPATNGRAISGRPTDAPAGTSAGVGATRIARQNGAAAAVIADDLPDEVKSQVRSGFISEEEARTYSKAGKSFTFED